MVWLLFPGSFQGANNRGGADHNAALILNTSNEWINYAFMNIVQMNI